jgi:hypothetical protein
MIGDACLTTDITTLLILFAAGTTAGACSKLSVWAFCKKAAHSPAGLRVIFQYTLVDIVLESVLFGLLFPAVLYSMWLLGVIMLVGLTKTLLLDGRLARWRDARVAACDGSDPAELAGVP